MVNKETPIQSSLFIEGRNINSSEDVGQRRYPREQFPLVHPRHIRTQKEGRWETEI